MVENKIKVRKCVDVLLRSFIKKIRLREQIAPVRRIYIIKNELSVFMPEALCENESGILSLRPW